MGEIQHFSHRHPLIQLAFDDKSHQNHECLLCGRSVHGGPVYGCSPCGYYLHKSCAELPEQYQHPFHDRHPLELSEYGRNPYVLESGLEPCDACLRTCEAFVYFCEKCHFFLDVECAKLLPTIKSDIHEHLLTLFTETAGEFRYEVCDVCDTHCSGPLLRCVRCNYSLHLHCAALPLPTTIKHECHTDLLTLTDSVVDYDDEDFYCDACERKRNPKHPVYYCAECPFIAHIDCVLSEVLPSIEQVISTTSNIRDLKLDKSMNEVNETLVVESRGQEQESVEEEKVVEAKLASSLGAFLGFTAEDLMMANCAFQTMAGKNAGAELAADPTLAKLDEGIDMLQVEMQALAAKLKELLRNRLQHDCDA